MQTKGKKNSNGLFTVNDSFKELILETLEPRKGPRQVNKHRNKQLIMSMGKKSGEITSDREEILKICANFYKSLYTQTVPTPENTMKSSPDTEEILEFTEEEVERAIKMMKRHKDQGMDGITSDIIKLGDQSFSPTSSTSSATY